MKYKTLFLLNIIFSSLLSNSPNQIAFVQQFISPNDLVFDVGAHIGNKTMLYLACGARVVCLEPQPSCCAILQSKFKANPQIIIDQIGVADKSGQKTLAICSQATTISTFSREWQEESRHQKAGYRWDTAIQVTVMTLDQLITKYGLPKFCKIDVENFEYEVLQGLSQPITYLSFEFCIETLHHAKKCLDHLENLGYKKFNYAAGEYPAFISDIWLSKKELLQSILNYQPIFRKKENDDLWGDIYAQYP